MSDITAINGKVLLDKKDMIRLLSILEPSKMTRDSNLFDVGYERAKNEVLEVVLNSLNRNWKINTTSDIIKQLREAYQG